MSKTLKKIRFILTPDDNGLGYLSCTSQHVVGTTDDISITVQKDMAIALATDELVLIKKFWATWSDQVKKAEGIK